MARRQRQPCRPHTSAGQEPTRLGRLERACPQELHWLPAQLGRSALARGRRSRRRTRRVAAGSSAARPPGTRWAPGRRSRRRTRSASPARRARTGAPAAPGRGRCGPPARGGRPLGARAGAPMTPPPALLLGTCTRRPPAERADDVALLAALLVPLSTGCYAACASHAPPK